MWRFWAVFWTRKRRQKPKSKPRFAIPTKSLYQFICSFWAISSPRARMHSHQSPKSLSRSIPFRLCNLAQKSNKGLFEWQAQTKRIFKLTLRTCTKTQTSKKTQILFTTSRVTHPRSVSTNTHTYRTPSTWPWLKNRSARTQRRIQRLKCSTSISTVRATMG